MSDFKVVNDKVVGLDPVAFEQGEQWVKCAHCGCKRPGKKMQVWRDNANAVVAICADEDWCDKQYGKQGY